MNISQLGRLEPIDLRTVWNNEAIDFTPWLAQEENLALLGETIGLDLELESVEEGVGPFRADILCKDTITDNWVLIENQLERTDHNHLGQLLTYAAGLSAVSIVWIADRFTDEHRAALDWLNDITGEEINFFGLEIELWRIGASSVAPKFNMVSKPNEWTKTVSRPDRGTSSELQQEQIAYWTNLKEYIEESGSFLRVRQVKASHAIRFALGRGGFRIEAFRNTRDKRIGIMLVMGGENAEAHFNLLEEQKADIESEMGQSLEWSEKPGRIRRTIALRWQGEDPSDRERWSEHHAWLKEKLELFYQVFEQRVKEIDATDYYADQVEMDL